MARIATGRRRQLYELRRLYWRRRRATLSAIWRISAALARPEAIGRGPVWRGASSNIVRRQCRTLRAELYVEGSAGRDEPGPLSADLSQEHHAHRTEFQHL